MLHTPTKTLDSNTDFSDSEYLATSTTKSTGTLLGRRTLRVLLLLFLVVWGAHFWFSNSFGLYEDDYSHIAPWMATDLSILIPTLASNFVVWPQGRPLHFSFPKVFGFIGFHAAGLQGIYVIGAIILTLNAFLFYCLLKRLGSEEFALLGALAFCLFPAATVRPFLTHALGSQPSLTFLLISIHFYLSDLKSLSYALSLGALLTFEGGFAAFLAAPLLKSRWNRELVKKFIQHLGVLALIALSVYVLRRALGDHRVLNVEGMGWLLPAKMLAGMLIGPVVSMAQWLLAPVRVLRDLDAGLIVTVVVAAVAFVLLFSRAMVESAVGDPVVVITRANLLAIRGPRSAAAFLGMVPLGAAGLVWMASAYGFAFTHFPPIARLGRGTSVHLAASLGASLLLACIVSAGLRVSALYGIKKLAIAVSAAYFALLAGYGVLIQRDYRISWQNQRSFWTQVVNLTADVGDGTLIFAVKDGLPKTRYILTHSWADPIILEQIYRFPGNWNQVPKLFVVENDWTDRIAVEGNRMRWRMPKAHWPVHWHDLPDRNVILIRMEGTRLARLFGTVDIRGHKLNLKAAEASRSLEKGALFDLMTN